MWGVGAEWRCVVFYIWHSDLYATRARTRKGKMHHLISYVHHFVLSPERIGPGTPLPITCGELSRALSCSAGNVAAAEKSEAAMVCVVLRVPSSCLLLNLSCKDEEDLMYSAPCRICSGADFFFS
mmetsp:Transcript_33091/g.53328  ORF Transcript_33091/g.53328 Transcript_33091/m.53328 type:complete len:125 (+) Transcript_33091:178-552(+)